MSQLRMPALRASPYGVLRSGLHWMRSSGESVCAREPIASCHIRLVGSRGITVPMPLAEEQSDLQVVLAPPGACTIEYRANLSKGGYQDLVGSSDWDEGEVVGSAEPPGESDELLALVLAGRRGFDNGEGRGSLLAGWHERARGFWEGQQGHQGTSPGPFGTVLALGTCEQTGLFRGEDMAFLSWFARAPGPAQIVSVSDERCVHSSAVILQHVRRTPAQAKAITEAVYSWIGERMTLDQPGAFPAFEPDAFRGTLQGRWPEAQNVLFALYLLAEAVGTSPILERTQLLTRLGVVEQGPPNVVVLSLSSELAPHFRHRRTGWIIAIHGFRFGQFIGQGVVEWLRRDFERVPRSVSDFERDLAALADEVAHRTGASLLMQNLVASSTSDRIANYSWLGESFAESIPVIGHEANLMVSGLTRRHSISVVDSDALAAELGVKHCPDRFHASGELLEAQRAEIHRVLRERSVPGF